MAKCPVVPIFLLGAFTFFVFLMIAFRSPPRDQIVVYGTMGCGWTRKQLDFLGPRADFRDCDAGECPPDLKSFPVVQMPDGTVYTGYTDKI
jgi:hypothetical protein